MDPSSDDARAVRRGVPAFRAPRPGWAGFLLALLIAVVGPISVPAAASADGDPGSDVLVYQNLFCGADDGVSTGQQIRLDDLLDATAALHVPIRVAIIGHRADLGSVTSLWGRPVTYARYLGTELELAYRGRLLVVMPQGVAVFWVDHGVRGLSGTIRGGSRDRLVAAAIAAVGDLEASAGISPSHLARAERSDSAGQVTSANRKPTAAPVGTSATRAGSASAVPASTRDVSPVIVVAGLLIVLSTGFWLPPLWRRRTALVRTGLARPGLGVCLVTLAGLVVLAIAIHSQRVGSASAEALATNPYVDPGSAVTPARPAPNFTLTDETGHSVSLSDYRGKVVILSFTDDECQTICPLTTKAMVDARDSLGPAAKDVQLLAVNANWRSTQVDDVLSYTELHGLLGQWHFLTGARNQLRRVWKAYGVSEDISSTSSLIAHTPALDVIDPQGRLREVYTTQSSYGAIDQFGQVLAREASRLLPGHPKVSTHYSYAPVGGTSASTPVSLPRVGGGTVTLGEGAPHLYLFFASWDQQSTPIRAEMEQLNRYVAAAKALGLPPITAIDEGSVEPNPGTVSRFLAGMHLDYPVAVDTTGRIADGYGVEGEPWFVLAAPGAADPTPWDQEVYTEGWPSLRVLEADVRGALRPAAAPLSAPALARDLAGSPARLAELHDQASRLLPGGEPALVARLAALRGYPVVINIWSSACIPCQKEFGWFAAESALYGRRVAFLGVDYEEPTRSDGANFLGRHHVSYPSYSVAEGSIGELLPGGVQGTPTTLFIGPDGKTVFTWIGQEPSEQTLSEQIEAYALGG